MELNRSRTAKYIGGAKARNIKNGGIRATPATKTHLLEGQGARPVQGLSPIHLGIHHPEGFTVRLVQGLSPIHLGIHHLEGFDLRRAFASHTPSHPLANRPSLRTPDRLFVSDTLTICPPLPILHPLRAAILYVPPSSTNRHSRRTSTDCPLCPIRRIVPSPSFATLIVPPLVHHRISTPPDT